MFKSLICGSFHEGDSEDDGPLSYSNFPSPGSIKKSRAKRGNFARRCLSDKVGHGKNPYAMVGLDKFSALLSDLEEKKKNIYLQRDSRDIMFVRFVYSGSEEFVPVIIKFKDKKQKQNSIAHKTDGSRSGNEADEQAGAVAERVKETQVTEANDKKIAAGQKRRMTWEMQTRKLGRPCFYILILAVLILLLLAIFGRSFAILCTSIGWYLVPPLTGGNNETSSSSSPSAWSMKKKKTTTTGAISRESSPRGANRLSKGRL